MSIFDVIVLSIGLAVDAACVCAGNGFTYRPKLRLTVINALLFGVFQGVMPLIGYFGVGFLSESLLSFNHIIAFVLLLAIGIKMLVDARKCNASISSTQSILNSSSSKIDNRNNPKQNLTAKILIIQAISTSIDALSVGLSSTNQNLDFMLLAVTIIAIITAVICFVAVKIGVKIGTKLNCKAEFFGGFVLILLGFKILIEGILF